MTSRQRPFDLGLRPGKWGGAPKMKVAAYHLAEPPPHIRAPEPDEQTIEAIIDATFWASLRREEGQSPKISLAFVPPEQAGYPLIFERPLPLAPSILTKLGPAVERPGIHLGVWPIGGELQI